MEIGGQVTVPYAVSMASYALGDLTALHELGHLMGGHHSDVTNSQMAQFWPDVAEEGNGVTDDDGDWQSIMGGFDSNGCAFSTTLPNTDCVRIPRWSDPDKTYAGDDRGVTDEKDMVFALETQMQTVAGWDTYPYSIPGTPSGFSFLAGQCYGSRDVEWTAPSHSDVFQMFISSSSSFTNPEIVYQGTATSISAEAPPWTTRYFKVRACNGS